MKRINIFISLLFLLVCLVGCTDESFLEIDSLSTDGNEFYCNQKVKVWMNVHSSDLWHTDYEWSCEGGTLTQPQGLDEMTWKAPNTPGTYTIKCKVTVGDKVEEREHKMYVSSYFFEKFEKSPYAFSGQSSTKLTLKTEIIDSVADNGYLLAQVNSSSEVNRYLNRSFSDPDLHAPFSIRAKLGFVSNAPTLASIKVGTKTGATTLEHQINCLKDPTSTTGFISRVSFAWYPTKVTFPAVPTGGIVMPEGAMNYNAIVTIESKDVLGKTTAFSYYYMLDKISTFVNMDYKKVGLAIDKDFVLHIYFQGEEIITTNAINEICTTNGWQGNIYIDNWRVIFPNGNGGKNIPQLYFDDAYASTTELLK